EPVSSGRQVEQADDSLVAALLDRRERVARRDAELADLRVEHDLGYGHRRDREQARRFGGRVDERVHALNSTRHRDDVSGRELLLVAARAEDGPPAQDDEELLHAVVRVQVEAARPGEKLVDRRAELLRAGRLADEAAAD